MFGAAHSNWCSRGCSTMPMCGGLSTSAQPSDEDKQRLTPVVKAYIAEHLGQVPSEVTIAEISRQIVNGTNHFLKVSRKRLD